MHWIIALSAVDPLTSVFGRHLPHSLFGAKQFSGDVPVDVEIRSEVGVALLEP